MLKSKELNFHQLVQYIHYKCFVMDECIRTEFGDIKVVVDSNNKFTMSPEQAFGSCLTVSSKSEADNQVYLMYINQELLAERFNSTRHWISILLSSSVLYRHLNLMHADEFDRHNLRKFSEIFSIVYLYAIDKDPDIEFGTICMEVLNHSDDYHYPKMIIDIVNQHIKNYLMQLCDQFTAVESNLQLPKVESDEELYVAAERIYSYITTGKIDK